MNEIDPHTMSNSQLVEAHEKLMECPMSTDYWRVLDDELNYRCEDPEFNLEWPY